MSVFHDIKRLQNARRKSPGYWFSARKAVISCLGREGLGTRKSGTTLPK